MKAKNRIKSLLLLVCTGLFLFTAIISRSGEFRSLQPIAQPRQSLQTWNIPSGSTFRGREDLEQISREAGDRVIEIAKQGIKRIFDGWNSGQIENFMDTSFYDRQRFLDVMQTKVPKDAKIRLLAIEAIHPLDQQNNILDPDGNAENMTLIVTTRVTATVRSQLEFNDTISGFQRREGRNEFILMVRQTIPLLSSDGR